VVRRYQPQIIFHLAAQPIVLTGYEQPAYTYEVNVMGTVNVLEAIRQVGCVRSFVNITTDKVYANDEQKGHFFAEDEKLDGFDPYSNSKSCSELVTHSYEKAFFYQTATAISTARAGNVIGGGDFSPNRIIPDCIRAFSKRTTVIVRNPDSVRPYQFVLEPLFVYLLLAQKQYENKQQYQGYYNVGPNEQDVMSTGNLVASLCKKWGAGANYQHRATAGAPHEAGYLGLDNGLLKKTFGWRPVLNIDRALDWIVEWSKTYLDKGDKAAQAVCDEQIERFSRAFADSIHL
jgi:CDP-glucose 4,6-dehydratase